jgi:hypothetical protein
MRFALFFVLTSFPVYLISQSDRWQQKINYQIDVQFDVTNHQFNGIQQIEYFNQSPDTLHQLFFHLYLNAFQPGSSMDIRSSYLIDPDRRVGNRISRLKTDEIGFQKINSLKINGENNSFHIEETILEINLNKPILPGAKTWIELAFSAQVPLQVRRNGRDSREGIAYSMAQWYPKLCQYDYQGWHANPYIAREFYGIWGDFNVTIQMDSKYMVGATGYLKEKKKNGNLTSWVFSAPNVHDFVWSADPDYREIIFERPDGVMLQFLFKPGEKTTDNWEKLPGIMDKVFDYANRRFGQYPYSKYAFLQGGDGGMEYPMATLITGERNLNSLVGVSVHELMHSWYQMVLASNESLYPWMDEGFTSYASNEIMNYLAENGLIDDEPSLFPQESSYNGYINFTKSGYEEPLITHADHFSTNAAYGIGSYSKGAVFLHQLEYIIGLQNHQIGLLKYYDEWKFKHPNVNDCIRVFEKISNIELDWYKEYFVNSTHTIDYGIQSVEEVNSGTSVKLKRIGKMPMPIDLYIVDIEGNVTIYHIPLELMRGEKKMEFEEFDYRIEKDWYWVNPDYELTIPLPKSKIRYLEIDASLRLADVDRSNNKLLIQP